MKTRVSFLLIFLCLFLQTPLAMSGKFADQSPDHDAFSFDGSTTSTSGKMSGYGQNYWSVFGSASLSGTAIELGQDSVYDCELWLMVSGDITSSPFPSKSNIDTSRIENGVNSDEHASGAAKISYLSHPVGSLAKKEVNVYNSQVVRELSRSVSSPSYAKSSPSSPTGLCASPEFHGELSGTLKNYSGSKSLSALSFASKENKACADSPDDGSTVVAAEFCGRKGNCGKPGTAKPVQGHSYGSHYVKCDKYIWEREGVVIAGKRFLEKKKPCPVYWWTCDDDPNDPKTINKCLRTHASAADSNLEERYVDADGNPIPKEDSSSSSSASLSGSGSASAGSTYQVTLTTPKPFRKLYWYVKVPGASRTKLLTTMQGGSSSTSASYTYHLPSSASAGNHVLNVLYYDYSDGVASYIEHTVSVSANLMACGHAKGTPGNHNYVRCPRAKDGARCRADKKHPGYHLACDTSHVHQYGPAPTTPVSKPKDTTPTDTTPTPTTPKKENPPLTTPKDTTPTDTQPKDTTPTQTQPQPTQTQKRVTCSAGHSYNPNSAYGRKRHRDRTCTRCSLTYQNCTNHGTACQNSKWHTEDPSAAPKPKPTTPKTTPITPVATYHPCGKHLSTVSGNHDLVYCPTQGGQSCLYGSYYACQGEHTHKYQTTTPTTPSQPQVTYHACGIHRSSVSGDHSLQASCSETNSNGDRCTVTSFYACQSHTHRYPAPPPKTPDPPPPPKSACPADSETNCGGSSSHAATCSAGHSYYTCNSSAKSYHKDRTCTRCSQTYQGCTNSSSACQGSKWHTENAIVKIKCGASGWTGCTTSVSSSSEHRTTCSGGHSYWTCGTANDWHKDRTCTRCSQTYQKCTNTSTACQGNKWHTGG